MFFSTTLFRVATPFRHMSWADFLLADILTSLAKPLSDCERALCHLLSGPVMLPRSTDQVGCNAQSPGYKGLLAWHAQPSTNAHVADVWKQLMDHPSRPESALHMETVSVLANMEGHWKHRASVQCPQVQHSIPSHHFICNQLSSLRRGLEQVLETNLARSGLLQLCILLLLGH